MKAVKTIRLIVAIVAVGSICIWKWNDGNRNELKNGATSSLASSEPAVPATENLVSRTFREMKTNASTDEVRVSLLALQEWLMGLPKEQALAMIGEFLKRGDDSPTGLTFDIGKDGTMKSWPTFRSFLIDLLAAIDPAAAAVMSREILGTPTNPDEWALALRNVARGESLQQSTSYLQQKTEELIANPTWQAKPTIGYLNAFDVLVHIEAVGSTPMLADLLRQKNREDLAHAGFLTLDRLVQRRPEEMLSQLASQRELRESRPEMVAQQFARADVRVPTQREILKTWLLDPERTAVELRSFVSVYPNNNHFVSNNLLTVESMPNGIDLTAHDREALAVISSWKADAAFDPVKEHLAGMIARLEGFLGEE